MSCIRIQSPQTISPIGWTIVDHIGLPLYWASIWSFYRKPGLAESTMEVKLRYINQIYEFADRIYYQGVLDDAISDVDLNTLGGILESYFTHIQNTGVINKAIQYKWEEAFNFVKNCLYWNSKCSKDKNKLYEIESRIKMLESMYSQLRLRPKKTQDSLRALPANLIQYLYHFLDPNSPDNIFPSKTTRWQVYVIFIILLHQGLRRGELLCLSVDAIKNSFDIKLNKEVYWLNVIENQDHESDSRYTKPKIKTASSIRQIPTSELITNIVSEYAENYRGKPPHSFLINSQHNNPLSPESIKVIFNKISAALPSALIKELEDRTGKKTISAHNFRHTCAVARLQQLLDGGVEMDLALQQLRSFFGWSRESTMPRKYAKAVFEDRLAKVWNKSFDDRVEFIRAIQGTTYARV